MKDTFEDWFRLQQQVTSQCSDPRFEVRAARPSEFESLYDLIDRAFGQKRERRLFDWIYRDNPCGVARCLMLIERSSGEPVWVRAQWPWPAARAGEPRRGSISGDAVTAPHLQRQRLFELVRPFFLAHPWYAEEIVCGWPNARSVSRLRTLGRTHAMTEPLARATLYLQARTRLVRRGWPRPLAVLAGAARAGWPARRPGGGGAPRVEEVAHFDAALDGVAAEGLRFEGYWFSRDADFLNWRYHAHPGHRYRSWVALRGEAPDGYAVLRLEGPRATLMELVARPDSPAVARALLDTATAAAREEDCERVDVFATPAWTHWALLRERGFVERPSELRLFLRHGLDRELRLADWQIVPGDHDSY